MPLFKFYDIWIFDCIRTVKRTRNLSIAASSKSSLMKWCRETEIS